MEIVVDQSDESVESLEPVDELVGDVEVDREVEDQRLEDLHPLPRRRRPA